MGFARVEAVKGYLNLYFAAPDFAARVVLEVLTAGARYGWGAPKGQRVMVEYSQPNTLKAFHVGHLRNMILGAALANILDNGSVKPMVNQILAHVGNTPFDLIDYARSQDILVQAYSPVALGALLDNADLAAMADSYGVSVAQLCIRYCLQLGLLPLPKTARAAHMRDNAAVDFVISDADMQRLRNAAPDTDYGEASRFPVFGKSR